MISVHSYVIKVKKVPKVVLTDVIFLRDNIVLTIFDSRSSLDKGLLNCPLNEKLKRPLSKLLLLSNIVNTILSLKKITSEIGRASCRERV